MFVPQILPDEVIVMIAQALGKGVKANKSRGVMAQVCTSWRLVVGSNPICWESEKEQVVRRFAHRPHCFTGDKIELLKQRFGLSLQDLLKHDDDAGAANDDERGMMIYIARQGDHATLRRLVNHFGFNAADARRHGNQLIRAAAEQNRTEFLGVLVDMFGLGRLDAMARNNTALKCAVMDNNAVVIEVLFSRFGLTVDDLAWGDSKVDAVHYAKNWQSFDAMLVLIDKFQLPGLAEIRRAWQERAVFSNNPYCWWMEHGSDFYHLFINEAVRTFGLDVDQ